MQREVFTSNGEVKTVMPSKRYEYMILPVEMKERIYDTAVKLNFYGEAGWYLVSVQPSPAQEMVLIFLVKEIDERESMFYYD